MSQDLLPEQCTCDEGHMKVCRLLNDNIAMGLTTGHESVQYSWFPSMYIRALMQGLK